MRYFSTGMALKTDLSIQFPPAAPVSIIPSTFVEPIPISSQQRRALRCDLGFTTAATPTELGVTADKNPPHHMTDYLPLLHIQVYRDGAFPGTTNRFRALGQSPHHRDQHPRSQRGRREQLQQQRRSEEAFAHLRRQVWPDC